MAAAGFFYTVLVFTICFIVVCLIKLAKMGLESIKEEPPKEEKKPPKESKPQPVYYIVEKKRVKRNYGTPREITFTDEKRK